MSSNTRRRTVRGRRLTRPRFLAVAVVAVLPATACLAGSPSASAAAPKLPDPCSLAPASRVAAALGLKVATKGVLSQSTVGKVTESKCTWVHAKITLFVSVTPYEPSGGSAGPPGMVVEHKPAGLGAHGLFAYDTNPKYLFSDASFSKGAYNADVHSNGPDSPSSVLTLARAVYAAIP